MSDKYFDPLKTWLSKDKAEAAEVRGGSDERCPRCGAWIQRFAAVTEENRKLEAHLERMAEENAQQVYLNGFMTSAIYHIAEIAKEQIRLASIPPIDPLVDDMASKFTDVLGSCTEVWRMLEEETDE